MNFKRLMVGLVSVALIVPFVAACSSEDNSDATVIAHAVAATQTRTVELETIGTSIVDGIAATQTASNPTPSPTADCTQDVQDMTTSEKVTCYSRDPGPGAQVQSDSQKALGPIHLPGSKIEISQGGFVTIDELVVQKVDDGTYRVSTHVTVVAGRGSKTVDPSMFVLVTESGDHIRGELAYTMLLPFVLDHTTLSPFSIAAGYVSFPIANSRDLPDYVIFKDLDQDVLVDAIWSEE